MDKYKERMEDEVKRAIKTVVSDTLLESEADVAATVSTAEDAGNKSGQEDASSSTPGITLHFCFFRSVIACHCLH